MGMPAAQDNGGGMAEIAPPVDGRSADAADRVP